MSDDWIRERALKDRQNADRTAHEAETQRQERARNAALAQREFPELWSRFGEALRRKADVYNREFGTQVFYVEMHATQGFVRAERSGHVAKYAFDANPSQASMTSQISTSDKHGGRGSMSGSVYLNVRDGGVSLGHISSGSADSDIEAVANRTLEELLRFLDHG